MAKMFWEHFRLVDGVSEVEASSVFNNIVLKQQMKLTQTHGIYLTKE
jgi:hypothetical protein